MNLQQFIINRSLLIVVDGPWENNSHVYNSIPLLRVATTMSDHWPVRPTLNIHNLIFVILFL
jgi:hypothetical protein